MNIFDKRNFKGISYYFMGNYPNLLAVKEVKTDLEKRYHVKVTRNIEGKYNIWVREK